MDKALGKVFVSFCLLTFQKKRGLHLAFFVAALFSFQNIFAQLILDSSATKLQLVNAIIGNGYQVSNIKLNCPKGAIGLFTNVTSNIGVTDGIMLTTGSIFTALGPNNNQIAGVNNGASGDFDLDNISAAPTQDACALEFDLVPACDTLKINYVFGSEEYPEYVCGSFNDIFAFFITGPNPGGGNYSSQNIALIPGTSLPVAIGSVNSGAVGTSGTAGGCASLAYSNYYVNNNGGTTIQYDGFTKPLNATAAVIPCQTYHLKLAIADVQDRIYDSGVFIKGNTITCSPINYNDSATNVNAIKSCSSGSFTFCRSGDSTVARTVKYSFMGTAINGIDYQYLPDSVVIPANQKCKTVNVVPIVDTTKKGTKTIKVVYQYGYCPKMDTVRLKIVEPKPFDAGPNASYCSNDSTQIGILPLPAYTYSWQPPAGLSDPAISNPYSQLINNGNTDIVQKYVVSITDPTLGGCVLKDSMYVTVKPLPQANMSAPIDNCTGITVNFTDNSIPPAGKNISSWYWDFGGGLFDVKQNPSLKYSVVGAHTIKLKVTDNAGCVDTASMSINVWPNPSISFSVTSACQGDSTAFTNSSTVPGGTILQSIWDFGDYSPLTTGNNPTHLYPNSSGTYTVQLIVTSDKNCVNSGQKQVTIYPTPVPKFTSAPVCVYDQMKFANQSTGNFSKWDFDDGNTSNLSNPIHKYAVAGSYNIKLISTSNYGCTDSITKRLDVYDRPQFDFSTNDTVGCPTFCAQFKSTIIPGSDSIQSWIWLLSTGEISNGDSVLYCYDQGGTYSPSLIATSKYGCKDTLSKPNYVTVYSKPNADFLLSDDMISTYDPIIHITDNSSADVTNWWWDFGDNTSDSTSAGPFDHDYKNIVDQAIKLKVKNNLGCFDSIEKYIGSKPESTVYIPNAFTPNDDALNNIFRPYVSGIYDGAKFEMNIFDRWGHIIAKCNDINAGWNGNSKGKKCQQDVYLYQIFFKDSTGAILDKFLGTVTLIK